MGSVVSVFPHPNFRTKYSAKAATSSQERARSVVNKDTRDSRDDTPIGRPRRKSALGFIGSAATVYLHRDIGANHDENGEAAAAAAATAATCTCVSSPPLPYLSSLLIADIAKGIPLFLVYVP